MNLPRLLSDYYKRLHKIPLLPLMAVVGIALSVFITSNLSTRERSINTKGATLGADLYFASQGLTLAPNSTAVFDVYLSTRGTYRVSAAEVSISLSSPTVKIENIEVNGVMPVVFDSSFTDTSAHMAIGVNPENPFLGTGQIARITLKSGNTTGTSAISFASDSKVAVIGVGENALASSTSSVITVGSSSATATPTMAISPTIAITPIATSTVTPTPTSGPGSELCPGRCIGSNTSCNNLDTSLFCVAGRRCCLD